MRVPSNVLLLAPACAVTAPAFGYESGDVIVRAGLAKVSPDVGTDTATTGTDVDDGMQIGLTATWMFSPRFGVELLAATPFKHDLSATGTTIGATRQLPTISAPWFPLPHETFQPYIGVGLNYTTFFDEEFNAVGKTATGANELNLTDSLGLALEAGLDMKITDKVVVNIAMWKMDINTDVEADGVKAGKIEIDPFAAMTGIGIRF